MTDPDHPYLGRPETRSHLGFGLVRPFRRDGRSDFVAQSGADLVRACIGQILGTLCSNDAGTTQGELPWRTDFGSLLALLRHRNFGDPATQQLARVYVAQAITRWEPRVRVKRVSVSSDTAPGGGLSLVIRLSYEILAGGAGNQVFVPDVAQVVVVPVS